jgi:hypothetical protein
MENEVIKIKTTLGTKLLLTWLSPIIAPIWLFSKFMFRTKSIKIEIEYE